MKKIFCSAALSASLVASVAFAAEGDLREFVGTGGRSKADACEQAKITALNAGYGSVEWEPVGECYGYDSVTAKYSDGPVTFHSARIKGVEKKRGEKRLKLK